jgi:hypothetical protein
MQTREEATTTTPLFRSGDSRPLAVLADEPDTVATRWGLRFSEGVDDLDAFRYAVVELPGALRVSLAKHHGDPNPGTVVRIDAEDDPATVRARLIEALGLSPGDVLWWAPGS